MDEILAKLDALTDKLESKRLVLDLGAAGGDLVNLVTLLAEGKSHLRRTRALFKEAGTLLQQGYGELVGLEEG